MNKPKWWPENPYTSKYPNDKVVQHISNRVWQDTSDECKKAVISELEKLQKKWESIKGTDDEYMDGYKECGRDGAYALKVLISNLKEE